MSITPIPLSCLKKEHQNESKTFQYNLYECSYLLRVKKFKTDPANNVSDVDIVMSALYERINCCLLVLVCSNGSLILYYKESSERPIIKQLNWFQNPSKRVVALCIDPVRGAWILCACVDGDGLYLIPVFSQIKELPKIVNVSPTWSLTDLSKIPFSKTLKAKEHIKTESKIFYGEVEGQTRDDCDDVSGKTTDDDVTVGKKKLKESVDKQLKASFAEGLVESRKNGNISKPETSLLDLPWTSSRFIDSKVTLDCF